MLYGSSDGRGVWGRKDAYICMAEFPCCSPETTTALLIDSTPIQNNKFNNEKKKRTKRKNKLNKQKITCVILSKLKNLSV